MISCFLDLNLLLCNNQYDIQSSLRLRDGGRAAEDGACQVRPRWGQRGGQDEAHLCPGLQPEGEKYI